MNAALKKARTLPIYNVEISRQLLLIRRYQYGLSGLLPNNNQRTLSFSIIVHYYQLLSEIRDMEKKSRRMACCRP